MAQTTSGLTDILHEALEHVDGALLSGLISTDGLGVDMVVSEDGSLGYDKETADRELGWLAATAASTARRLDVGELREIILEADDTTYLISFVTRGYYAALGLRTGNVNLGRARFAIRQMVSRLQEQL